MCKTSVFTLECGCMDGFLKQLWVLKSFFNWKCSDKMLEKKLCLLHLALPSIRERHHVMPYALVTVKQKNTADFPYLDVIIAECSLKARLWWQERPSCMTHLFIKKMVAVCHRSVRAHDQRGIRLMLRKGNFSLAQPSAVKLLFIPTEYMMTRKWLKASLQMTK